MLNGILLLLLGNFCCLQSTRFVKTATWKSSYSIATPCMWSFTDTPQTFHDKALNHRDKWTFARHHSSLSASGILTAQASLGGDILTTFGFEIHYHPKQFAWRHFREAELLCYTPLIPESGFFVSCCIRPLTFPNPALFYHKTTLQ